MTRIHDDCKVCEAIEFAKQNYDKVSFDFAVNEFRCVCGYDLDSVIHGDDCPGIELSVEIGIIIYKGRVVELADT